MHYNNKNSTCTLVSEIIQMALDKHHNAQNKI
jgi:hypothetical protein